VFISLDWSDDKFEVAIALLLSGLIGKLEIIVIQDGDLVSVSVHVLDGHLSILVLGSFHLSFDQLMQSCNALGRVSHLFDGMRHC